MNAGRPSPRFARFYVPRRDESSGAAGDESVSVIVPTYNRADECQRAVKSVLAQTLPPFEIIICDNGSAEPARSKNADLALMDARIRVLSLPENSGSPAAARNVGLRKASGRFAGFLDDDDEWLPDKLAMQLPALGAGHSIVCGNALCSDGLPYFRGDTSQLAFGRIELLRDNPVITSTAIVNRRELLEVGGFPESRRLAVVEDYGAWLTLADRGATGLRLPEIVALYNSQASTRLSVSMPSSQSAATVLAWRRWRDKPFDIALLLAVLRHSGRAVKVSLRGAARRISRTRSSRAS
jgi:teichuronic acid biosynthesis glycosyltransferase TuaG